MHASARRSERLLASAARSWTSPHASPSSFAAATPAWRPVSQQPLQRRHRWFSSSDASSASAAEHNAATNKAADGNQARGAAEGGNAVDEAAAKKATEGASETTPPPPKMDADPFAQLQEKHKEEMRIAKHQLLTSMADLQNLQKRTAADVKSAREFAIQSFAKDIVADLDVLSLAMHSVPQEQRADGPTKALFDGISLTSTALQQTLARHGVVAFDPTGQVFNPNEHEAMFQAPMPGKTPGTVFDCQTKGWKIGSRLLRPAQVGVVLEA